MNPRSDTKKLFDRTLDLLKSAGSQARDGIKRTYEVSALKIEISGLRRSLEDVTRELGLRALGVLREQGRLTSEDVAGLLRRVDELEDQIATRERQIAEVEVDDTPAAGTEAAEELDMDTTLPRRPGTGDGADTPVPRGGKGPGKGSRPRA